MSAEQICSPFTVWDDKLQKKNQQKNKDDHYKRMPRVMSAEQNL